MFGRVVEKKEWRKNINACWDVQEKLHACLAKNNNFKKLDSVSKSIVQKATGKQFIYDYINHWVNKSSSFSKEANMLYDTDSLFWNNGAELVDINTDCNLFSLFECCKEKYNLENLKGNYEFAQRALNLK